MERIRLLNKILSIESELTGHSPNKYLSEITALRTGVRLEIRGKKRLEAKLEAINVFLFEKEGFGEKEGLGVQNSNGSVILFQETLDTRCGECYSLACVYFSVAGEFVPLSIVHAPMHIFLRTRTAAPTNIEPTANGMHLTDDIYINHNPIQNIHPDSLELGVYLRSLPVDLLQAHAYESVGCNRSDPTLSLSDFNKAVDQYRQFGLIPPPNTLFNRGKATLKVDDAGLFPQALQDYTQAVQYDPLYAKAWKDKAVVHLQLRDYDGALLSAEQAVKLGMHDDISHIIIATVLVSQNRIREALLHSAEAFSINPTKDNLELHHSFLRLIQEQ